MLSMGGVDGENRTFTAPTTADPWTYGIGVLDMTELKWTDSYDPDAPDYESPTVVNDWYNAGNLDHVHWENAEVEAIFMKNDPAPSPKPTHQTVASNSTSTGVIVGGAVGGILGIAAIGMMSFVLVRRSRAKHADSTGAEGRKQPQLTPSASVQEEIGEYRPEPWPKDHQGSRYAYSPESVFSGVTAHSASMSPPPMAYHHGDGSGRGSYQKAYEAWPSELSGHQDGIVPPRGAELPGTQPQVGELMDPNMEWAYELPAPLESNRTELPDRKYSH